MNESNDRPDPLEVVEACMNEKKFDFDHNGEELNVNVEGKNTNMLLSWVWMPDIEALHLVASVELPVPADRMNQTGSLVLLINGQERVGYFDYWEPAEMLNYRTFLFLPDNLQPTHAQIESMLVAATTAPDHYYPAFKLVRDEGKTPQEALEIISFPSKGSA